MILSPEILDSAPRKVAPKGVFTATMALGLIVIACAGAQLFAWTSRSEQHPRAITVFIAVAAALAAVVLLVIPMRRFRAQARLLKWGAAKPAKIVSRSVATGRGGASLALTYEFIDDFGQTIRGDCVLWGDIKPDGRTNDPNILDALAAPTVFHDRINGAIHLLYPHGLAKLVG